MDPALLEALGIAAGGALSPGSVLIVILLLNSRGGAGSALAYVSAYSGGYFLLGLLSLWVGDWMAGAGGGSTLPIGPTLLLFMSAFMLTVAYRKWRNPPGPDAPPPRLLAGLDAFGPGKAFAFGAIVPVMNFKNLGIFLTATATLAQAPLQGSQRVLGVALTALIFCGVTVIPLAVYALVPGRSAALLTRMRAGLERHNHRIMLVMLPLFASLFLFKSLTGFWALYGAA